MRQSLLLLCLVFSHGTLASARTQVNETRCKAGDCLRNGWTTTGDGYSLNTVCKNNDCKNSGWHTLGSDRSTHNVQCRAGGCFTTGWHSEQVINGQTLQDEITCENSACLRFGWTVRTGYDQMGGNTQCIRGDCSRFGNTSTWRGRPSRTTCFRSDCFHDGWVLSVD